jgi:hypothetical protein
MAGDPYAGARVIGSAAPTSKERMSAADLEAKYLATQREREELDRLRRTPIPQPAQPRETPGEKARGAYLNEMATATGKIDFNLPKVENNVRRALAEGQQLIKHPGFEAAVGLPNPFRGGFGPLGTVPGTTARGFKNRLEQVQGGAFLNAFEALKGAGAITEQEGLKATAAMSRMNEASSESDFKSALQDYMNIIADGYRVAKTQVKRGKAAIETGGTSTPSREAIQREMQRRGLLKGK